MRVAVFSDVHGNLTALDAVLADIDDQQVDEIVFAGDLCLVGPRPAECVARLQTAAISSIFGNTDDWVLGRQQPPPHLQALCDWTLAQLDKEARTWLDSLPFSRSIAPTGKLEDDLLIVHANPLDVNQLIFPSEAEQTERYGRIRQSDTDLDPMLKDLKAGILGFGHLHIPNVRQWRDKLLINISSVNMPGDGDARAKYGLFIWDGQQWQFEHRFVAYQSQAESDVYHQAQPPGWQGIVEKIETMGAFPQNV
ncbi:MAG: metallophosphoesterase family protein [Anaerolineales bacterium]|nr:metallophosphoesterase family protein [Anaerolineales bacterium]